MESPVRVLSTLAVMAAAMAPAAAAKFIVQVPTALDVPLGCRIESQKVLAVTNISGGSIPAGTHIGYSFQRNPDHAVITGYVSGGTIAPGQVIRKGIVPAYSCKAWFRKQPVAAQ
ncbi:MAG: hypothetical protein J0H94_13065 [Rhizobiales bacterium]|nr:hypothetical protein [Hyphomicrobiales bacterium]